MSKFKKLYWYFHDGAWYSPMINWCKETQDVIPHCPTCQRSINTPGWQMCEDGNDWFCTCGTHLYLLLSLERLFK